MKSAAAMVAKMLSEWPAKKRSLRIYSTLAKTVRTHIFEVMEEFHEVEKSGNQLPMWRERGGFHGMKRPVLT